MYRQIRETPLPELKYWIHEGEFGNLSYIATDPIAVPIIDIGEIKSTFFREFAYLGDKVHEGDDVLILYDRKSRDCYKIHFRTGTVIISEKDLPEQRFYLNLSSCLNNLEPLEEKLKQLHAIKVEKS